MLLEAFAAGAAFSVETPVFDSDVFDSELEAFFSAFGFGVSPADALPLVPLVALEVSVGGGLFLA